MKKYFGLLAIVCLLCIGLVSPVYAQINPISSDGASSPLLGNEHTYSVTVKASGTVIVNARIILSNNSDQPKTNYKLSGLEATQGKITGYQQIRGRRCITPDYTNSKCSKYGDPNYSVSYYDKYDEPSTYKTLAVNAENGEISGALPKQIEPYQTTAIILSYYLPNQTTKGLFGARKFVFSSLRDEDLIKNVTISVSTDSDLYVKGNKSRTSSSGYGSTSSLATSSISSQAFDSAVSDIGMYGNWMYKTGKDIVPGEVFKVSGAYSTSWFGLYWYVFLIFLLIVAALILGIWWLVKKSGNSAPPSSTQNSNIPEPVVNSAQNQSNSTNLSFREAATFRNFLSAFLVGAVIILILIGGAYLFRWLETLLGYSSYAIIMLSEAVLAILFTGIAIGYPIYLAVKKGLGAAAVCVISYLLAIIIAIIISVLVTTSISDKKSYEQYPMINSTTSNI
jgi:hypothetical protein